MVSVKPVDETDPERRTEVVVGSIGPEPVTRLILPAESSLSVERLRELVGGTDVELAPTATRGGRRRLVHPGGVRRLVALFGATFLFYLSLGGFAGGVEYLTGAISAAVVSLSLSQVAMRNEPTVTRTLPRIGRMVVFLPVLLWEVLKANVVIAAIILHPRLPIDPSMSTLTTRTKHGLERTVLANSITLTPGTLTVDVQNETFVVHSLTTAARDDLDQGRLGRLVSWVFHGSESGAWRGGDGE
ncbi:Na+/H+ antiporter subunit E [Haloarchaeobius sp. TZWWS8]|uniref:Na+/H+ antiporter subunit E n=1 Tax=Haloarchaeobius sp. TZWWS8 TaxID=3446121 RepID=UPI003EBB4969